MQALRLLHGRQADVQPCVCWHYSPAGRCARGMRWYSLTQSLTISIWSALCLYADAQDPRADEHIRAISASAPVPASANTVTGATGGAGEEPKPPLEDAIEKCVGAAAALFTIWSH